MIVDGAADRRWLSFSVRLAWKVLLLVGLIVAAKLAGQWVEARLAAHLTPSTEPVVHRAIMVAVALYVVLMALPFVPGVEIGLTLIAMFGAKIVPVVYAATVLALFCSFMAGRLLPEAAVPRLLDGLRLHRAAAAIRRLEALPREQRLEVLVQNAPLRIVPILLRHRYLALMVALNIPGNALIGGGGGIGLAAGYSRLFTTGGYLAAVAIAVTPVPMALFIFGK
jgi:hypothetical protein